MSLAAVANHTSVPPPHLHIPVDYPATNEHTGGNNTNEAHVLAVDAGTLCDLGRRVGGSQTVLE